MVRLIRTALVLALFGLAACDLNASPAGAGNSELGTLPGGARYLIEMPDAWNGDFVLYAPGSEAPTDHIADASDQVTHTWLLGHGYALGGTSYASDLGYTIASAVAEEQALFEAFKAKHKGFKRAYIYGESLGGAVATALLEIQPPRFVGAFAICGAMAGAIGHLNVRLDGTFVFKTLLMPSLSLDPGRNFDIASQVQGVVDNAQSTPVGRARLDLAMVIMRIPAWRDGSLSPPPAGDFPAKEAIRESLLHDQVNYLTQGLGTGNYGVDYSNLLALTGERAEVQALYQQSGASLDSDLQALSAAPRVRFTVNELDTASSEEFPPSGYLSAPLLTIHTTADDLVPVEEEGAYASAVAKAGKADLLRQVFVHRPGHCNVTPAETLAGLETIFSRTQTRLWVDTSPVAMNARAQAHATIYDHSPPAFIDFTPGPFPRPYWSN